MGEQFDEQPKILGTSEEDIVESKESLKKIFSEPHQEIADVQLEPTPEEQEVIDFVKEHITIFIKQYTDTLSIPPWKFYLVPEDFVKQFTEGRLASAFMSKYGRDVVVERKHSHTDLAMSFAHELFHLCGYTT